MERDTTTQDTTKEHPPLSETGTRTRPPGNPPRDEEAVRTSEEKLQQAGGGH
jgi:hypothetical protein